MQTRMKQSHRIIALALFGALLAGCAGNPAQLGLSKAPGAKPGASAAAKVGPSLGAMPRVLAPTFVATDGAGALTGTVAFELVNNTFFANSAANYRVSSMPSANALVSLSTLEEQQYTLNGAVINAPSDATGKFSLTGAPTQAFVVNANLVGSHRLSALALPGQSDVTVNEISTAIAETFRWQLRPAAIAPATPGYDATYHLDARTLADLTASDLADLDALSASYFDGAGGDDVALTPAGDIPSIDALKLGAGHLLRNLYVAAFGGGVSTTGSSVANQLSDKWAEVLGFRPLGLTRAAGTGQFVIEDVNGKAAADTNLVNPIDAVSDHNGNLYIAEDSGHFLRIVVNKAIPGGLLQAAGPLEAGKSYVIGGFVGGPTSLTALDTELKQVEQDAVSTPSLAPDMSEPTGLYTPTRIALERVGTTDDYHIYFTSRLGNRVFLIPGANFNRYGRDFLKGRLYTVAGVGTADYASYFGDPLLEEDNASTADYVETVDTYFYGDEGPAYYANLNFPTGMALDGDKNVFLLDSGLTAPKNTERSVGLGDDPYATKVEDRATPVGNRRKHYYHGTLRVVSSATGNIFTIPLEYNGSPYILDGASDVRVQGTDLYIVHKQNHAIFKTPLPTGIDGWAANPPAQPLTLVLGKPGTAGFIDTAAGAKYPDIYDVADGIPAAQVLLNEPQSVEWDHDGNLVVSDRGNGRIRLVKDGKVYTIAGGLDTHYLSGDARLALLPASGYLNRAQLENPDGSPKTTDPLHNTLLVPDFKECLVRRLHTSRGYFPAP